MKALYDWNRSRTSTLRRPLFFLLLFTLLMSCSERESTRSNSGTSGSSEVVDYDPIVPAAPFYRLHWYHLNLERAAFEFNRPERGDDVAIMIAVAEHPDTGALHVQRIFTLDERLWRGTMDLIEPRLSVDADGLHGEFLLWYEDRGMPFELQVERQGDALSGIYRALPAEGAPLRTDREVSTLDPVQGPATGYIVSSEALKRDNSFESPLRWPGFTGRSQQLESPGTFNVVRAPEDVQVHWRSDTIWGPAFTSCRNWPWLTLTPSGGPSSIIGDDNILFLHHRRPRAQQMEGDGETIPCFRDTFLEEDQEILSERLYEVLGFQPADVYAHIGVRADEVITAIDGITGQTLWETTFESEGVNFFDTSDAPNNLTGAVDRRHVYTVDSLGVLRALSRATGEVIWERQLPYRYDAQYGPVVAPYRLEDFYERVLSGGGFNFDDHRFNQGLAIAEDYVIAPRHDGHSGLVAYEGSYGLTLWTIHERILNRYMTPLTWFYEDISPLKSQDYLITIDQEGRIHLVDAKIGRIRWRHDTEWSRHGQPLLVGDVLITHAGAYRISLEGAELLWDARGCVSHHRLAGTVVADQVFLRCNLFENDGDWRADNCRNEECTVQIRNFSDGEILREMPDPASSTQVHAFSMGRYYVLEEGSDSSNLWWNFYDTRLPTENPSLRVKVPFRFQSMEDSFRIHPSHEGRLFVRGEEGVFALDFRRR